MSSNQISVTIISISLFFVFLCLWYTSSLEETFTIQEQKKMQEWAKATEMFLLADDNTDISFITSVIENNTTIPVYMLDKDNNILFARNVEDTVKDPTSLHGPIVVRLSDDITQYIYYEDSLMIRKLRYFPYIELSIIFIFIAISVHTLRVSQKNEQNLVWVGLCKETAHQLGTPISSLHAWYELMVNKYPGGDYLPYLKEDIDRLTIVTNRFSNIGSVPVLKETPVQFVILDAIEYMQKRVGTSTTIEFINNVTDAKCMLNESLFSWVIENLIKNAVDAMRGSGKISIYLNQIKGKVTIDVADTGCGIDRKSFKKIFLPGFTTKKRGWGLGLNLCKRIIEQYHHGEIFVLSSIIKKGTVVRIRLDII